MGDATAATGRPSPRTGDDVQLELWRREVEASKARHEAELEHWRTQRLHQRRTWRLIEAVLAAVRSRSPRRLLGLPLALVRILTDARPAPPRPQSPELPPRPVLVGRPSPVAEVRRARAALAAGDAEAALAAAEAALAVDPRDVRALDVAHRALEEQGELARALAVLRRQRAVQDRTWLATAERRLQGLLVALDPRWAPEVPPFAGTDDGPVLLLDPGGPDVPAAVRVVPARDDEPTPLGQVDERPLDVTAQDTAWWACRAARAHRPCAVAATLDDDLRCAIAAWALARASGVPLLLVTGAHTGPTGEHGRLVRGRTEQLRAAAAAVVDDVRDLPGALRVEGS